MIETGTAAPDFELRDETGEKRTLAEFRGKPVMLVFYPGDFSPLCNDQLSIYQEVLPEIEAKGAQVLGISVDSWYAHAEFHSKLGLGFPLLSDFKPKGGVAKSYGCWFEPGDFAARNLVLVDAEGVVSWVHESENPGEIPGANLIFDALER